MIKVKINRIFTCCLSDRAGIYLLLPEPYLCPPASKLFSRYGLFFYFLFLFILISTAVQADEYATLTGDVKYFDTEPMIIYLEPVSKNSAVTVPKTQHSSINSRDNTFEPAFQVVQIGSILEIKNNDAVLHNAHISKDKITLFNVATPLRNRTVEKVMPRTGFFYVACDLHPWMSASVAVVASPYYSVLWKPGSFQINNIVPGKYYLHSLQPEKDEIITLLNLKENGIKQISF